MDNIFGFELSPMLFFVTLTTLLIYFVLKASYFARKFTGKYKLPSGPWGIPLLGNLLQMGTNYHLKLSKWGQQYGKLCTIHLGPDPALLISDPKYMKEIFGTFASTGKFKSETVLLVSRGPYGVINAEGKEWAELRQFCLRGLRKLGFGSGRSMEPVILRAVGEVCDWIQDSLKNTQEGYTTLIFDHTLKQATLNTLWELVTSERINLGDSKMSKLMHEYEVALQYSMKTGLGFFSWIKHLAPELSGYNAMDKACKNIHEYVEKKFDEHRKTFKKGVARDLLDMYIEHLNQVHALESSFHGNRGIINSVASIVELFIAGGETTSVTINWASNHLAFNQAAQMRLYNEIDGVIGRDCEPSLLDKERMPYTEAVILETLRISSIAPIGLIHRLLEDLSFHDYIFPKGLLLVPNIYCVHHNPEIWGDPKVFQPERFLSDEKVDVSLKENLVSFQPGKRQCLGESLAKDELFLFLTKLIQQYHIGLDPKISQEEYFKPDVGFFLLPKAIGLVVSPREN